MLKHQIKESILDKIADIIETSNMQFEGYNLVYLICGAKPRPNDESKRLKRLPY